MKELPDSVDAVAVPSLLTVTAVVSALECPLRGALSVWNEKLPQVLPPHPKALLGSLLHRLLEMAGRGQLPPDGSLEESCSRALAALLDECDEALRSEAELQHYVPLEDAIPFADYLARVTTALADARRIGAGVVRRGLRPKGWRTGDKWSDEPAQGAGVEVSMECPSLRLRGRVDALEVRSDEIVIRDFKTGRISSSGGVVNDDVRLQLRLYGLMAQRMNPGKLVSLAVERGRTERIPFTLEDAATTEELLKSVLQMLPAGSQLNAKALARVGKSCCWCDRRHVCAAYMEEAPAFWAKTFPQRIMPLDTWGRVVEATMNQGRWTVHLRDGVDRHVSVAELDGRHGDFARKDAWLWFFGLENRGQATTASGAVLHPSNFRELAAGPGEGRAYGLKVFGTGNCSPKPRSQDVRGVV